MAKESGLRNTFWGKRAFHLILAFLHDTGELERNGTIRLADNSGLNVWDDEVAKVILDYLRLRVQVAVVGRRKASLEAAVATLIARIAEPQSIFEKDGIDVGLSLGWRELRCEQRVQEDDREQWIREMKAVPGPDLADNFRRIIQSLAAPNNEAAEAYDYEDIDEWWKDTRAELRQIWIFFQKRLRDES